MELNLDDDCPICREPLSSQWLSATGCNHAFHYPCLDEWLANGIGTLIYCPICRCRLSSEYPRFDICNRTGWRVWTMFHAYPFTSLFVFNVRDSHGRCAVGQISPRYAVLFVAGARNYLRWIMALITKLPRLNISLKRPDYERVIQPVSFTTEEERTSSIVLDGVVGPFLWQEGDPRTHRIQQYVDRGPEFSITWLNKYISEGDAGLLPSGPGHLILI